MKNKEIIKKIKPFIEYCQDGAKHYSPDEFVSVEVVDGKMLYDGNKNISDANLEQTIFAWGCHIKALFIGNYFETQEDIKEFLDEWMIKAILENEFADVLGYWMEFIGEDESVTTITELIEHPKLNDLVNDPDFFKLESTKKLMASRMCEWAYEQGMTEDEPEDNQDLFDAVYAILTKLQD